MSYRYYHNSSAIDVTQLRVSRYHRKYPTSMSLSQDPSLWKALIKDLYNKFPDKVRVAEMLKEEKEASLYRVCATNEENYALARGRLNRFNFCKEFAAKDENQRTPTSEFDSFVSDFLQRDFRRLDIDTKYCVMSHRGYSKTGLPAGFPQMLVELCSDTLTLVDFMEISARKPFTSDLNRLLRNFCYHVLVNDTAKDQVSQDVWERHSTSMYETYRSLRDELDRSPQKYGIIRNFLRTPQFNDDNVDEVIKRYLMSTAILNIVLFWARDQQAARQTLKGIKEAVEEVDACQRARGIFLSEYSKDVIDNGICGVLLKGIRCVLQVQCVRDAQLKGTSKWRGDGLKLSLMDDYKQLARKGRKALMFGRREKIDKWITKVNKTSGDHERVLKEAMGLMD